MDNFETLKEHRTPEATQAASELDLDCSAAGNDQAIAAADATAYRPIFPHLAEMTDEDFLNCNAGYDWPASRLTERERRMLVRASNQTGKPMNQILKEAVKHYTQFLSEHHD